MIVFKVYYFFCFRGVLQTLVEKHFPAPDRNRIQRLLGLEAPTPSLPVNTNGVKQEASSSSNKRKTGMFYFFKFCFSHYFAK